MPRLVTDPIWSLRVWPVEFAAAGELFVIPAMPAADWLTVLMGDRFRPSDVVPGFLELEDQQRLDEFLRDGSLDVEEYVNLGLEVLSGVCGRPWWVSLRLVNVAAHNWDAVGSTMVRRVDPERVSIAAWLDVLMPVIVEGLEEEKRAMFLLKLEAVPEGWGEQPVEEMTAEAFLAMAR